MHVYMLSVRTRSRTGSVLAAPRARPVLLQAR